MTLNDLEGHSPVAGFFNCNPSNICAAFCTISTDSVLVRFLCVSRASLLLLVFLTRDAVAKRGICSGNSTCLSDSSSIKQCHCRMPMTLSDL